MASTTRPAPMPMPACVPVVKPEGAGVGVGGDVAVAVAILVVVANNEVDPVDKAVVLDIGLLEGSTTEEGAEEAVDVILEASENSCSGLGAKKVSSPGCEQSRPRCGVLQQAQS